MLVDGRQPLLGWSAAVCRFELKPFVNFACCCIRANGSKQPFRVSGKPMFSPAGRHIGSRERKKFPRPGLDVAFNRQR